MSAAALAAHRQTSEPYSKWSRSMRDRDGNVQHSGSRDYLELNSIRGRAKHQLPCEP